MAKASQNIEKWISDVAALTGDLKEQASVASQLAGMSRSLASGGTNQTPITNPDRMSQQSAGGQFIDSLSSSSFMDQRTSTASSTVSRTMDSPATRLTALLSGNLSSEIARSEDRQRDERTAFSPRMAQYPLSSRVLPAIRTKPTAITPSTTSPDPAPVKRLLQTEVPGEPAAGGLLGGNERLYEAYNELHGLAQHFRKPFDSPAVLIVGHQTDGKSALVEALMGFQFNHVGGGTKTRRPITLQMSYNAACTEPRCFLASDSELLIEEPKTLQELQAFIERENRRLESEPRKFSDREIVVRVEYKYCPNLTIIDTPGLISAAPSPAHNALQEQARVVEDLVVAKMRQREFIILCLEDSGDWSNATTRRVVMKVDPDLSRTILVSTKLDTRIPQFSRAADVEMFLNPALPTTASSSSSRISGRPFFTSVPSGRVGSSADAVFSCDDDFRAAVAQRESIDINMLVDKMGRPLTDDERSRIGVSRLRMFLEHLLQQRYLESVPYIVPLLETEHKTISNSLLAAGKEIQSLSDKELRDRSRSFRDSFMRKLTMLLRGTIAAPPDRFGETLQEEQARAGIFMSLDGQQLPARLMPNASMRLYGGAQYHRAMAEFRFVVGAAKCPSVTREEIVNACGIEDVHDGTNFFRTACILAVAKAWDVFEPFLRQLGCRLSHIARRLLSLVLFLLEKEREPMLVHDRFVERVTQSFYDFVDETERSCISKCIEDLTSTTRFVTWSLHNKSRSALRSFFDNALAAADAAFMAATASHDTSAVHTNTPPTPLASAPNPRTSHRTSTRTSNGSSPGDSVPGQAGEVRRDLEGSNALGRVLSGEGGPEGNRERLVDLLEGTLWTRRLAPTSQDIVTSLVGQIFEGIRDHFVTQAELKFNCFFLMPLVDSFPQHLREDLEIVANGDLDSVFDISRVRKQLEQTKIELQDELARIQTLQSKFSTIHRNLSVPPSSLSTTQVGLLSALRQL